MRECHLWIIQTALHVCVWQYAPPKRAKDQSISAVASSAMHLLSFPTPALDSLRTGCYVNMCFFYCEFVGVLNSLYTPQLRRLPCSQAGPPQRQRMRGEHAPRPVLGGAKQLEKRCATAPWFLNLQRQIDLSFCSKAKHS